MKKCKFCHHENLTLLEDVDIDNIVLSSMVSSGEKKYTYLIRYKDHDYKIKLLYIMLPETIVYVKRYDGETKWMNFLIKGC